MAGTFDNITVQYENILLGNRIPCGIFTDKYHRDSVATALFPCLGGKRALLFLHCTFFLILTYNLLIFHVAKNV